MTEIDDLNSLIDAKTKDQVPLSISNGSNASLPLRTLCADLHAQVEAFLQENVETEVLRRVQKQCRHSLGIIQEALSRYPLPHLSLSYNGGKDCLVLLILYLSLLSGSSSLPPSLPSILIPSPHPFPEVDAFIASSAAKYHLSLSRYAHPSSMRAAFAEYLASPDGRAVEAILVGTRRTDPHGGELTDFDKTDHGWPDFMRVHPVLEWRYGDVWAFLRHLGVEFCGLYERGYTSLGGTRDTRPNPLLRIAEGNGGNGEMYKPAWRLEEEDQERAGREVEGGDGGVQEEI